MKKLWSTILIISASSIFAFSQTETPTEANWTTFAPEKEEFSIEVPVSLNGSITQSQIAPNSRNEDDAKESRRYLNTLNGNYFYIFSDYWETPSQYKFVLKFAYDSKQLETTQKSGELTTTKFEFSDSSDFYHTILAVNGKNRIYVFHTVSPTKDNPIVERFFSSIKFNQKSLFENSSNTKTKGNISVTVPTSTEPIPEPPSPTEEPEIRVKMPPKQPEVTVKTPTNEPEIKVKKETEGYGLGNGRGNSNQTETKINTSPTAPNKVTAGVKILSKPRANYTDFARFYEIQGKVVLRVQFSADGAIRSATPISKLPFGLTEQALIAVRGIRFEPAMREGVPYSVTKPVEYTFTIY